MNDIFTIKLGIGLGDLRFGATRGEVQAYLGQPDKTESEGDPGKVQTTWHYDSIKGYVSFDEDDNFRLGTMESASRSMELNGQCLIGQSKCEVLDALTGMSLGEFREELNDLEKAEDKRDCLLYFDSQSLSLWFEDNILTEIQWGYLFNESGDKVVWPEIQ